MNKVVLVDTDADAGVLAVKFARIIASGHNQHVIAMFVGGAGKGKSWAALDLATETTKEVAKILGGNPEDYFNLKENLGTIGRDDIKRVMTNPKKHAIIICDDVSVAWNARRFQDDFNIFLNDLIQTFRPNHNLVILTLQEDFLLDKVPRSLIHYLIVMEQSYFDLGFTTAKVFKVVMKHLRGKIFHEYLVEGNVKYVRHVFTAPDKSITDAYEEERARQLKVLNEKKAKQQEKVGIKEFYPYMKKLNDAGMPKTKIAELFDVSKQYIGQIFRGHGEEDML